MRDFVRWAFSLVVVCVAIPVAAGNIGFIDTSTALKTVQEGQRQYRALETWADQRSDEFDAIQKNVADLTQQLENQRAVASPETIQRIELDLIQAQRDLEDSGRVLQSDFEAKQRDLLAQVAVRVRTLIAEYAEANGIEVVFPLASLPVAYIADSVIITEAVIQLYDERYPVE